MEELTLKSTFKVAQKEELSATEQALIDKAIEATHRSYVPYSKFHVGTALLLKNGEIIQGCNQENAAFTVGICAERAAIFAAGAKYPDQPVVMMAIAARTSDGKLQEEPISPCGSCRQVLVETETRFGQPVRLLLYGSRRIIIADGIGQLMPLLFSEF